MPSTLKPASMSTPSSQLRWASDKATVDRILDVCRRRGVVGFDTETYGHDVETSTAPYRARVHVWSLAVLTDQLHPRCHYLATGFTLSREALDWAKDLLEDPDILKIAWNLPHDVHACENENIHVRGGIDGLPRCRVACPWLPRHGLKTASPALVGRELTPYEQVVKMEVTKYIDGRACSCQGATPGAVWTAERCKRQGRSRAHESVPVLRPITANEIQPLQTIVPGHPLFPGLCDYAMEDAVAALECWSWMDNNEPDGAPDPGWTPQ